MNKILCVLVNVYTHQQRVALNGLDDLFAGGRIHEMWEEGRRCWTEGLRYKHHRHRAILALGHYFWFGDKSAGMPAMAGAIHAESRANLIRQTLEKKHNGFSKSIRRGKWRRVEADIPRAVEWTRTDTRHWQRVSYLTTERQIDNAQAYFKKTGRVLTLQRMVQANCNRSQEARARIADAIKSIRDEGGKLNCHSIARRAGSSRNTVIKHLDLWSDSKKCSGRIRSHLQQNDYYSPGSVLATLGGIAARA